MVQVAGVDGHRQLRSRETERSREPAPQIDDPIFTVIRRSPCDCPVAAKAVVTAVVVGLLTGSLGVSGGSWSSPRPVLALGRSMPFAAAPPW